MSEAGQLSAIFADVAPLHQFQVISALFQRRASAGIMLSARTVSLEPELQAAARLAGVELIVGIVESGANPVRESAALGNADALLLLPDSALWNAGTLRGVLQASYRRGQPVIGFSDALVASGALASAYTPLDDLLTQVEAFITSSEVGRLPPATHPDRWRVAVNETVSKSMGFPSLDEVRALSHKSTGVTQR